MYSILKNKDYVLRVEMEKFNGETAYAEYKLVSIFISFIPKLELIIQKKYTKIQSYLMQF